jgi:hypothetical protein
MGLTFSSGSSLKPYCASRPLASIWLSPVAGACRRERSSARLNDVKSFCPVVEAMSTCLRGGACELVSPIYSPPATGMLTVRQT